MTTTIDELFLKFNLLPVADDAEHHGIKGMKWGVRRERGSDGTVGGNLSKVDPRHLSEADLRAAVNRMQLERQFSQLAAERVTKGNNFAKSYLKNTGKRQIGRIADKAIDLAVEQAVRQVAVKTGNKHVEEVAKRLRPKKK